MNNKEKFIQSIINNSGKKKSTINKYARAIEKMSKDLAEHSSSNIDIYKVVNSTEIDQIKAQYLAIDILREKNKNNHREYTSSLPWYKKYLESEKNLDDLVKNTLNEYSRVFEKKAKGEFTINEGIKKWKRDKSVVDRTIAFSDNKCEYNDQHEYFISNKSGKNYVEGHHLIQMKYQDDFEYSLDVDANVVSLCVICHKILHFGKIEDKVKIINKLYELRKNELALSGLEISLEELIDLYKQNCDS